MTIPAISKLAAKRVALDIDSCELGNNHQKNCMVRKTPEQQVYEKNIPSSQKTQRKPTPSNPTALTEKSTENHWYRESSGFRELGRQTNNGIEMAGKRKRALLSSDVGPNLDHSRFEVALRMKKRCRTDALFRARPEQKRLIGIPPAWNEHHVPPSQNLATLTEEDKFGKAEIRRGKQSGQGNTGGQLPDIDHSRAGSHFGEPQVARPVEYIPYHDSFEYKSRFLSPNGTNNKSSTAFGIPPSRPPMTDMFPNQCTHVVRSDQSMLSFGMENYDHLVRVGNRLRCPPVDNGNISFTAARSNERPHSFQKHSDITKIQDSAISSRISEPEGSSDLVHGEDVVECGSASEAVDDWSCGGWFESREEERAFRESLAEFDDHKDESVTGPEVLTPSDSNLATGSKVGTMNTGTSLLADAESSAQSRLHNHAQSSQSGRRKVHETRPQDHSFSHVNGVVEKYPSETSDHPMEGPAQPNDNRLSVEDVKLMALLVEYNNSHAYLPHPGYSVEPKKKPKQWTSAGFI